MRFRFDIVVYAFLGMAVAIAIAAVVSGSGEADATGSAAVPHYQRADVRVRCTDEPQISRGQDPMLVQEEYGTIPSTVSHLTILTDENCQPDAEGVSHCRNRVQFETATGIEQATLRHHHRMAEEPCFTPGQYVEVVR
ncbi:MAG TPA: hypothetical protein VGR29_00005 [Thermomicrobiales bacterium]|nr:hypothetical protein [Thermomicrobiales bacterium]